MELIQRLNKPYPQDNVLGKISRSLAFGGGLRNGGISDSAMEILHKVFTFDYMGSAEYEFGKAAEALNIIWDNRENYTTKTIKIPYKYKGWRDEKTLEGKGEVYIIAPNNKDKIKEAIKIIKIHALDYSIPYQYRTKEPVLLNLSMAKRDRTFGWIDLNKFFFFFIDKEMFNNTCKIFEIEND